MHIQPVTMTRPRYSAGRPHGPPRVVVLHATAGHWPSDFDWLRAGGGADPAGAVSIHYLISPAGEMYQFVSDADTAWHTGASSWLVDGQQVSGSIGGVAALNWRSIGIELSHPNRADVPYPAAQVDAAVELTRLLVQRHAIPRGQLVRHLDIAPGRKTDPAGFPWASFVDNVYRHAPPSPPEPAPRYTADALLMERARGTEAQAVAWFAQRSTRYTRHDILQIVAAYAETGEAAGLDWFLAMAQCAHETGSLTSWWCDRPRRNPAGLGVTGHSVAGSEAQRPGQHWAWRNGRWWEGISFPSWVPTAIQAHLGRLVAYAMPPDQRFGPSQQLADLALAWRPLPLPLQGAAPRLCDLDGRWAVPGVGYGATIAAIANRMRGL